MHFTPPESFAGESVTLKFGSVNYLADVWLNGTYLGYHEGGYTPFAFDTGKALVDGGCDDPIVLYCYCVVLDDDVNVKNEIIRPLLKQAMAGIYESHYPINRAEGA